VITANNSHSLESLSEYYMSPLREGIHLNGKLNSHKMLQASLLSTSKVRLTSKYNSIDTERSTLFDETWKVKKLLGTKVDSPR